MAKKKIKAGGTPQAAQPRMAAEPDAYKRKHPVWRFSHFDWDGPWGIMACLSKDLRKHVEQHLASFETMTWAEIERAAGGKGEGKGTNHHPLSRDKFSKSARDRLADRKIYGDVFFSLRLEATVRIYGIREENCLRVVWFDPYHFKGDGRAAYGWS